MDDDTDIYEPNPSPGFKATVEAGDERWDIAQDAAEPEVWLEGESGPLKGRCGPRRFELLSRRQHGTEMIWGIRLEVESDCGVHTAVYETYGGFSDVYLALQGWLTGGPNPPPCTPPIEAVASSEAAEKEARRKESLAAEPWPGRPTYSLELGRKTQVLAIGAALAAIRESSAPTEGPRLFGKSGRSADGVPAPVPPRPRPAEFLVGSCRPGSSRRADPSKELARRRRAK